ncbi:hypothetical protein CVT24_000980 [Panaeolus cyanescens]|uniref:Uncharacterized protein n=1 Tax=Panaeolus cyanescens TaxID=181874 RepID=A0A409YCF7_9AGAR|nr:hypothetical protein CVT24_000980 [Panaeolus cyanescens]
MDPRPSHTPLSTIRIVASTDGQQYRVVDVSGAPNGSWIRQRIFAKLSIPEQLQQLFFIYPTEVGSYALGGALSDRRLFAHCLQSGDPSGSLKVFVSTAPDRPPTADPNLGREWLSMDHYSSRVFSEFSSRFSPYLDDFLSSQNLMLHNHSSTSLRDPAIILLSLLIEVEVFSYTILIVPTNPDKQCNITNSLLLLTRTLNNSPHSISLS